MSDYEVKDVDGHKLEAVHYRLRSREGAYYGADRTSGKPAHQFVSVDAAAQWAARYQKDDWKLVGHFPGQAQVSYAIPNGGAGGSINGDGMHEIPAASAAGKRFEASRATFRRKFAPTMVR